MTNSGRSTKQWRFFRAGGFDQVKLETGDELMGLDQLDYKLWVALACPTTGVEFDKPTLELIDTDKDGRVRAPELLAAVKWAGSLLRNPDELTAGAGALRVSSINDSIPEGKAMITFARQVLGKSDYDSISIDEAATAAATLANKPFNGDGIVPADSIDDPAMKGVISDIISCVGAATDASGKLGIGQEKVEQFFKAATAYSDWWKQAESNAAVLPLGQPTATAAAAVKVLKPKVEDYFTRCRFAAFEPNALNALNREEKEQFMILSGKELTTTATEVAAFPLAHVAPGNPLPLGNGINPAWADTVTTLRNNVVKPLLGDKAALTESEWTVLEAKLAPYEAWAATKDGAAVDKLGLARVREILAGPAQTTLAALIAKDKAEETHAQALTSLNRLVRYHCHLMQLCLNFVSFEHFYSRKQRAIFQAGTLYLDQRSCDLCLRVQDPAKHAAMAALAGTYLAYCDCMRKGTGEKMQIVAGFTAGDSENLMVGRNGLFIDAKGQDWDATITKIIDNPISIRQAFFAPYKKLVRLVEEQVAKRAAAADAAADTKLAAAAKSAVAGAPPPKPAEPPKKLDTGTLAAIGLVLTTLLAALGGIFGKITGLAWWQIPLAILAIILLISLPSVVMAYLKLRRRNLGPILDANGWAVNAKAKLNVPFGGSLTAVACLPAGSQRDLVDPFAEKKSPWPKVIVAVLLLVIAALVLNHLGLIYDWTGGRIGHRVIKVESGPAVRTTPNSAPAGPAASTPVPEAPA